MAAPHGRSARPDWFFSVSFGSASVKPEVAVSAAAAAAEV
jgi:hypothetical protein